MTAAQLAQSPTEAAPRLLDPRRARRLHRGGSRDDARGTAPQLWAPRFLPSRCIQDGGCLATTESEACDIPCSAPPPPGPPDLNMSTCSDGLLGPRAQDGALLCEPPPRVTECPKGQYQGLGDSACVPIGAPCGGDAWPTEIPSGSPTMYVQPGATNGDGARSSPVGNIAAALASARGGAVVVLARGEHRESALRVPSDVTLVGACVAGTTIRGVATDRDILILSSGAAVSGIALDGDFRAAISLSGPAATASVAHVEIAGTGEHGLYVADTAPLGAAHLEPCAGPRSVCSPNVLRRPSSVRDTQPDSEGNDGQGFAITTGELTLDLALVLRSHGAGILASDAGTAHGTTTVDIQGAMITGRRGVATCPGTCPESPGVESGELALAVFVVSDFEGPGVVIGSTSTVAASSGHVRNNRVAARLPSADYEARSAFESVTFTGNDALFDYAR